MASKSPKKSKKKSTRSSAGSSASSKKSKVNKAKQKKSKARAKKKAVRRGPVTFTAEDFEIRPSGIAGIGDGLFSKNAIRKGDTIGYYTGKILTDNQANSPRYIDSAYLLWICKDHWIWGEGKLANYTRYINHSAKKPNVQLVTSVRWKTARFEALKNLKAGTEIFFDYGPEYWENMDFKATER